MPPLANVSAAAPPAGPPPMTATRRLRFWSFGLDLLAVIRKRLYEKEDMGFVWEWSTLGCSWEECRSPVKDLKTMEEAILLRLGLRVV